MMGNTTDNASEPGNAQRHKNLAQDKEQIVKRSGIMLKESVA